MAVKAKPMDDDAKARVDRLVTWCIERGIATSEDGKRLVPKLFAEHASSVGLEGRDTYWMGILAKGQRPFAAKKARLVEDALKMPRLYLDGGSPPAKAAALKITDLNEEEAELVMLFRQLGLSQRQQVIKLTSELHERSGELPKDGTNHR